MTSDSRLEPKWRRYLRFFGAKGVADLDDELRFHIDMRIRDYVARGLSESEARAATAQRLGDMALARDACVTITTRRERRMTRTQFFDALRQDVTFALRSLNRQKVWTLVAVVTLALGIGANTAMFSVVNHLLLNPLPYPNATRIVIVSQSPSQSGNTGGFSVSMVPMGRMVAGWVRDTRAFEQLQPYLTRDVTIQRGRESPRVVPGAEVLPSFAAFAGKRPLIGRVFTDAEARGEATVGMISEGLWRSQFGADRSIIGQSISVNEKPLTIVGVLPGGVALPRTDAAIDVWLPLDLERRDDDGLFVLGRLPAGVDPVVAAAELDSIASRNEARIGRDYRFRTVLGRPADEVRFQEALVMLTLAVAVVLLIACANVAHLLLSRAATRQREMAVRVALGAATGRLFRQLLTESLLLSAAGCFVGLGIGWLGLRVLIAARPESLSQLSAAKIDGMTLLVATLLMFATAIVFGLVGAVQAARQSTNDSLKAGSASSSATRSRGRARSMLVVSEMALSMLLLVGAVLLLKSVARLQGRDAGFDTRGLYALTVHLPNARYKELPASAAFLTELAQRARTVPGVVGVTQASAGPMGMSFAVGALQVEGQPEPPAGTTQFIPYNGVDAGYFTLMGIPIVRGTTFTDTSTAAGQVIVNEGFARKHWPGQSAVGKRLRIMYSGKGEWQTVVGIAGDALTAGLAENASDPLLYKPGTGVFRPQLLLRTTNEAASLPAIARIATSLDDRIPPPEMKSVALTMQKSIGRQRFTMFLLLTFTVVAVGLAAVGLYGVLAYNVAQRSREIGIRVALGASRSRVARSILGHGLLLGAIGAVVGLVGARWGVRVVAKLLFGVQQTDAGAFALGAAVLMLIAALACLVPVRRALSVDPLIAIKAD
jgi:putative ABC transport system permease protein